MFTFNEKVEAPTKGNGIDKISQSFKMDREVQKKAEEELKGFRQQLFEEPSKFVKAVVPNLPPKQQNGMIYGTHLTGATTITNEMTQAKLHARELLGLLQELKTEAQATYSTYISMAFYNDEKKAISDKALAKYHELDKCIKTLQANL